MNGEIESPGKKEDLGKGGVKVLSEWKVKKKCDWPSTYHAIHIDMNI